MTTNEIPHATLVVDLNDPKIREQLESRMGRHEGVARLEIWQTYRGQRVRTVVALDVGLDISGRGRVALEVMEQTDDVRRHEMRVLPRNAFPQPAEVDPACSDCSTEAVKS